MTTSRPHRATTVAAATLSLAAFAAADSPTDRG